MYWLKYHYVFWSQTIKSGQALKAWTLHDCNSGLLQWILWHPNPQILSLLKKICIEINPLSTACVIYCTVYTCVVKVLQLHTILSSFGSVKATVVVSGISIVFLFTRPDIRLYNYRGYNYRNFKVQWNGKSDFHSKWSALLVYSTGIVSLVQFP